MHKILNKDPSKLLLLEELGIENSSLEYLVAIDYCSYRMPCKTVLGDRSYKLTKKRFQSKQAMLEVYKEAASLKDGQKNTESKPSKSIFDIEEEASDANKKIGLEHSVAQLKQAIEKAKNESPDQSSSKVLE